MGDSIQRYRTRSGGVKCRDSIQCTACGDQQILDRRGILLLLPLHINTSTRPGVPCSRRWSSEIAISKKPLKGSGMHCTRELVSPKPTPPQLPPGKLGMCVWAGAMSCQWINLDAGSRARKHKTPPKLSNISSQSRWQSYTSIRPW